jgi:hypothetical protein
MNDELLKIALSAAVPLWILKVRSWPEAQRAERAKVCGQMVASHGDVIMFKQAATKKNPIGSAEAFNALAEGLALLSFYPGGVKFADLHWETK